MDIAYLVRRSVAEHPDAPAVSCGDRRLDYRELDAAACRLANALRGLGLQTGDRVAVLLENRLEYPVIDVGIAYAGLVRVALNARLGIDDFSYVLLDCDARALITQAAFDDAATKLAGDHGVVWIRLDEEASPPDQCHGYLSLVGGASDAYDAVCDQSERLAWISYTSGTTGRPKGVMLSHSALTQVAFNVMVEMGAYTTASSILLAQPLSHGAGYFVLPYLASGGCVHIMRRFDAEQALELGREHNIRTLKLVPTMLMDILETNKTAPFKDIVYGAAPVSERTLEQALDRFGPILSQIYGQSEAPMTITYLRKEDHVLGRACLRSAGRPWRSVPVEIVDSGRTPVGQGELGEVVVGGPHVMMGYYGQSQLTDGVLRDGWVWTKDMAVRDDEGYIYLRGRRDEMINSGGFNIAPKEVEDVVSRFSGIREAVAVGMPHERWGQTVRVYVVADPDVALREQALIDFCKPALGFRHPRSVVILPHLPKTPYGKVDRARLLGDVAGDT